MTLTIETPAEAAQAVPNQLRITRTSRALPASRSGLVGLRPLWSGPLANPRRIRLTAPGNPVHR
jgi:hypothetical protein